MADFSDFAHEMTRRGALLLARRNGVDPAMIDPDDVRFNVETLFGPGGEEGVMITVWADLDRSVKPAEFEGDSEKAFEAFLKALGEVE